MRAKEYLQQLQRLDTMINQKIKELDDLKVKSTCIDGFDYSKDRVQTSPSGDAPYVRTVSRIVDLNEEINREIDDFVDIVNEFSKRKMTKEEIIYEINSISLSNMKMLYTQPFRKLFPFAIIRPYSA